MRVLLQVVLWMCLGVAQIAQAGGLQFEEEMRGYGLWQGSYRDVHFDLAVRIADVDAWRSDPSRVAQVTGTVQFDAAPPIPITGDLQVLSTVPGISGRLLIYRFWNGQFRFYALKHVHNNDGPDLLDDVTTLRGRVLSPYASWPTPASVLAGQWSSEVQFEWWRPTIVAAFVASFQTIDTPWYDRWRVKWVFIETTFGNVASEFFWGLF